MLGKYNIMNTDQIKQIVKSCKQSASYFMENFCKIKHPLIGIIPIKLFKYQRDSLLSFRQNRFCVFKKCRQCGASTLTGIYALWIAMFFSNKKILIVSKRDQDAKEFLKENVKFVYDHLPSWMKEIWKTTQSSGGVYNEHEIGFSNGSIIRSLTSSPDTLRSNASFLNIIDEAAFMPDMEAMWAGGWSTLQHGGSVIVISTPNGQGNWYWDKWTDASDGSLFHPILINWWDMDWVIEAHDPVSNTQIRIAPTDNIRKCESKEEVERWGPYYSPWLKEQMEALRAKGEAHLFRQEVLAEFIGGGGTILSASALYNVGRSVKNAPQTMTIAEPVNWVNQATGESEILDFVGAEPQEGLWVWSEPIKGEPATYRDGKVVNRGVQPHTYIVGVDTATGENNDYSAIEVFDVNTMEQVAEYMGHVQVSTFAKMVDWIGRWYNNALVNPERSGIGSPIVQDLRNLIYPNIWRQKKIVSPRPGAIQTIAHLSLGVFGFSTTNQSKPTLNKALITYIGEDDGEGYTIYSTRLYKQLQIYIRHKNRQGTETKKTGAQIGRGNHDDLVIAAALAFHAIPDTVGLDPEGLLPTHSKQALVPTPQDDSTEPIREHKIYSDPNVIMPMTYNNMEAGQLSPQDQLDAFTKQLVGTQKQIPVIRIKRNAYGR